MRFDFRSQLDSIMDMEYRLEVSDGPPGNDLFIKQEALSQKGAPVVSCDFARDSLGRVTGTYVTDGIKKIDAKLQDGISVLNLGRAHFPYGIPLRSFMHAWQFVSLVPQRMSDPKRQKRAIHRVQLEKDGSNVAEYLAEIQKLDASAFADIISSLQL